MALVTQITGMQKKDAPRTFQDILIDFGTGFLGGVLLNDIWEIAQLPGYYVNAFPIGTINVGYDDIIQDAVIPAGVGFLPVRGAPPIAIGMSAGGIATKLVEQYGGSLRLQIIPHQIVAPAGAGSTGTAVGKSFQGVNDTENQLRMQRSMAVNDTQNQLRRGAMSVRFSMR